MGKRTEDEIQRKLADLEVAMKHEQAMKQAEDAIVVDDDDDQVQMQVARVEQQIKSKEKAAKKRGRASVAKGSSGAISVLGWTDAELYKWGGVASLAAGFLVLISKISVIPTWPWGGAVGAGLLIPLFVGIGMLIYNYKSKVAQVTTVASFAAIVIGVLLNLRLGFLPLSLFDLILLVLPTICGVVLLAKSFVKQRETESDIKLIE